MCLRENDQVHPPLKRRVTNRTVAVGCSAWLCGGWDFSGEGEQDANPVIAAFSSEQINYFHNKLSRFFQIFKVK